MGFAALPARQLPVALAAAAAAVLLVAGIRWLQAPRLKNAVENGSLARVAALIRRRPDLVRERDRKSGMTPLHWAVVAGQEPVAAFLLTNGAAADAADAAGMTPLHKAAAFERPALAALLLAHGASVEAMASKYGGVTLAPLHLAAEAGHVATLDVLLRRGANVNVRSGGANRVTPLHMAAARGQMAAVRALLKAGADVNARDLRGQTPLRWAEVAEREAVADLLRLNGGTE